MNPRSEVGRFVVIVRVGGQEKPSATAFALPHERPFGETMPDEQWPGMDFWEEEALTSHTKCFSSRFAKVNSRKIPSTYS